MPSFSKPILSSLPHLTFVSALDIFVAAIIIYQFLMAVRGRRAAHVLAGLLTVFAAYGLVSYFGLELIRAGLSALAPYAPFALIVLFQSEIRRVLARIGGGRWISVGGRLQKREFTEELVLALAQLHQQKVGALVVLE